ncbi:MAG: hypothetical protein AAB875_04835, partial [Patescibacteria group bacterium]
MSRKLTSWFAKLLFPTLIIILTSFIAWRNYEPGTILSGWDTLHPEFNLSLYFKRAFYGVWQEHQGLGAVASQAHPAELPRLLIVSFLSLFVPLVSVRYSFFFLCLGLGALGIYFFAKYLLADKKYSSPASFLGSLFYVLNLTTVQHFYVPLEMFAVHFAVLPWLFFLAASYLKEGKKSVLIFFSLATIFSASMAHTPTLFYVYILALVIYLFSLLILIRKKEMLKRGLGIILVTLLLNLYWILPNLYYIKNHAEEVANSKIHRIFSDEAFLQSKSFGDIKSLALLKNFLFNWREYDASNNKFIDLMDEWKEHLADGRVEKTGYILFSLATAGILVSLARKNNYALSLLPILDVSVFFLINSNPPFTGIFNYLRDNFELFKEGLRFPFTKFSILLTLPLAVYFSFTSQFFLEYLGKIKLAFVYFFLAVFAIFIFAKPVFYGGLISPSMRVKIPDEYFQVFDFFSKQDVNARVAKFPVHTHWGWNFHSWDYQGAGFTWFGIPQPTLDREFDRWSYHNQGFYSQINDAVYSQNVKVFQDTLKKYQVRYLFLDESIVNVGGNQKILFLSEIKSLIESSGFQKVKDLGFLTIYETGFNGNFLSAPGSFIRVNADLSYSSTDPIYEEFDTYIIDEMGRGYPFVNPGNPAQVKINIEGAKIIFFNPVIDAKAVLEAEGKIAESFSEGRGVIQAQNCNMAKLGWVSKERIRGRINYKAGDGGVACDFFVYPELKYNQAYVLRIKGENKEGRSLKIYLQNLATGKMDLEELLAKGKFDEVFFLWPKDIDQGGYTLNLETRSYGKVSAENILELVEFYPVSYNFLKSIYTGSQIPDTESNGLELYDTI